MANVPCGINTDIETGRFHQTDGEGPALLIRFRVGYTAHTALRVRAELGQCIQVIVDPPAIDTSGRRRLSQRDETQNNTGATEQTC